MPDSELCGLHEASELLGLSRQAVDGRRRKGDFPAPHAVLKATPVWTREQLVEYAQERAARFEERGHSAALGIDQTETSAAISR